MNKNYTRRDFMKMGLSGAAATMALSSTQSIQAGGINPQNLAQAIIVDPVTLSYMQFGSCCWYCQSNVIVAHYQPVYFIEVFRASVDSALTPNDISPIAMESTITGERSYQSFETRIWTIPDWVLDISMGYQSCKLCGPNYVPKDTNFGFGVDGLCDNSTMMTSAMNAINSVFGECLPKLIYDSSIDFMPWRTGCAGITDIGTHNPISCISGFEFTNEDCIGEWGPKYPLQMAKFDSDPRRAAAVTGLRGLTRASELGLSDYSADTRIGKLQQTLPQAYAGYWPGTPLASQALERFSVSANGTYGFVWWLPAGCCKSRSSVWGWCTPQIPCV